jgi:hypothetical protein
MRTIINFTVRNISPEAKIKLGEMKNKKEEYYKKILEDYHKGKWDKYFDKN